MKIMPGLAGVLLLVACSTPDGGADAADGGGVGAQAGSTADTDSGTDQTPTSALSYVAMAGASDLYEIQSSSLALQKAQDPQVRAFAQMMIDHHTGTTRQVTAAAQAAGLNPPPPSLMPMQANMIDQLRQAPAGSFDRTYIDQQRTAHRMALALHRTYAERGDTPQLRSAASGAVPIVQQHIERLERMPSG